MRLFQTENHWIDPEKSLTLEAECDKDGKLLRCITSTDLMNLINQIQLCRTKGAIWTGSSPVVTECGVYPADAWIDGHIRTIKVWVVPSPERNIGEQTCQQ